MRLHGNNEKGFTLIEVVVSLVLVGIMAAIAGLGIVQATKAFIFTKEASVLGQKGDLAMSRIRRSVQNLTNITAATATSLTVQRLDKGVTVTESYNYSGGVLTLSYNGGTARTLTDSLQAFSLAFAKSDGSTWTTSSKAADLATVAVSSTIAGSQGASVTYADKVVPRNTFMPGGKAFTPAGMTSGGFSCFVATVAYGNGDYPSVKVLRQFRDLVLMKFSAGRAFVAWYYRVGPGLADSFKSSDISKMFVRIALLPFVGTAFLILYFPAGIPLFLLMALILARLAVKTNIFQRVLQKRPYLRGVRGQEGSVLVGLIVTMVVMAIMAGAMVSMYSAANAASIPAYFSQHAYYLAESGRNYAVKTYLANKDSDTNFIGAFYSGSTVRTYPVGNDNFNVRVKSYYYNTGAGSTGTTLTVSAWGELPDIWKGTIPGSGSLQVPTGASSTAIVNYTAASYNSANKTITFTIPSTTVVANGRVQPVVRTGAALTVYAKNIGDPLGDNLSINVNYLGVDDTFMLPPVNGTISFVSGTEEYYIMYDKIEKVGSVEYLKGIRHFPGKAPIPSAGVSLAAGTPLVVGRYAQFVSTGTVGSGSGAVSQTIYHNQPLDVVKLYSLLSGAFTPVTSVLGGYASQSDGSIKITRTEQTYSYVGSEPTYMQESFQAVSWDTPSPLKTLWEQSNYVLSYDLQAKIKFTETEDDTSTTNAVNHPGNYMPGIAFRVKCEADNSDCTYYGVSLMRGVQGRLEHSSGSGCSEETYYTEEDDISDNMFAQFGSNSGARPRATDISCTGADRFVPNTWTSTNASQSSSWNAGVTLSGGAPLDGIPYVVFWQKDWSTSSGGICGGETSPWNWLAFMPLVEAKVTQVYYYPANTSTGRPAGWYEANITNGNSPFGSASGRRGPFTAWKLRDKYGVLKTSTQETRTVLGIPGYDPSTSTNLLVRDTSFLPVNKWDSATDAVVGFILPNVKDSTYSSYSANDYQYLKASRNYRIYPKPWVTLAARIVEMVGDFDCNSSNGDERVNAIMAYVSDPDGVAGTFGGTKDTYRKPYTQNPNYPTTTSYTVRWPDVDDYFTMMVWDRGNYTSQAIEQASTSCGWINVDVKLVEKGKDSDNDNVVAYTAFLTTEPPYFTSAYNHPEFGYHTAGISAASGCVSPHCESAYFTDGYWQAYRGGVSGMLPGIQSQ